MEKIGEEYEPKKYVPPTITLAMERSYGDYGHKREIGLSTPFDYYVKYKARAYTIWVRNIVIRGREMLCPKDEKEERELDKEAREQVEEIFDR